MTSKPSHSTRYGSGGVISRGRAGPVVVAAPIIQPWTPSMDQKMMCAAPWLRDARRGHRALAAEPGPREV
jgi:hypothetical protein